MFSGISSFVCLPLHTQFIDGCIAYYYSVTCDRKEFLKELENTEN